MKLITAIEKQKKNKQRYNIYLDDEYTFSCNEELVVTLKLKKGKSIDVKELLTIIQEDNRKEAFNKALNYLTPRSRTQQEIINYLTEKGYDTYAIDTAIERLKSYQFIDDEGYTHNFVKNRSQSQLKGKRLIQKELSKKGVDEEIIEMGLTNYSPEEELENALKIGKQYFISKKNLPLNQIKQKLSNKLMGKGYSWEIISQCFQYLEGDMAIQELMDDRQDLHFDEAKKLAMKYYDKHSKKEKNPHILKMKMGAYLYQKGYQQDTIYRVLDEITP
ncbi:RecX family transcriptional regulator [Alkaliphilus hydrothermalis]|uniref:Regulatory protein RecX n=1 Tax=Alkaliphilus hydrothermalis TaxID=1482730 RepID=A0ABS2NM45_9FIRM|nr:RecX family transcriptional regulator [Alkaliphilus hydrothermalis]MBM7614018.1 regulatory protein [Alkaliphilus hydrothermalis]